MVNDDEDFEPIVDRLTLRAAVKDALNFYRKQIPGGGDAAWNAANQIIQSASILAHLDCRATDGDSNQWQ